MWHLSLNWDEVSHGFNALSLLKTGRDEWGIILPTIFRAFGDYKLPVFIYMTVVTQNPRLVSTIAWLGLIFVTFILGAKFFGKKTGVFAGLLVAISPWTLFLSGVAVEANLAAFLITLGIYLLLVKRINLGLVFLGLSMWTYNSARVFTPLFLFVYWFKTRKNLTLFLLFLAPMLVQLFSPGAQSRIRWLNILDEGAIQKINSLRTTNWSPLVYNKVTYFSYQYIKNYFSYLSPTFLFIKGGDHYQFSMPNHGLLYLICLPFFVIGIVYLIKQRNWLFLSWLLLSPIAGSFTRDSPHVLRAIVMLPLPMLFSAIGLVWLGNKIKYIYIVFFVLLIISFLNFKFKIKNYVTEYSWSWQYGYKQVVQHIKQNYDLYDQIIFTKRYGEPHEFVAFYWPWDPENFYKTKQWDYHSDWYWVDAIGKIRFVNDWEMKTQNFKTKTLIISSPENESVGDEVYRVNFLDGKPAFIIKKL